MTVINNEEPNRTDETIDLSQVTEESCTAACAEDVSVETPVDVLMPDRECIVRGAALEYLQTVSRELHPS
ncbi:hypothetical protein ACEPAF_2178 [Sanghuangporus sanghuang]